jgi:hypothetical protein
MYAERKCVEKFRLVLRHSETGHKYRMSFSDSGRNIDRSAKLMGEQSGLPEEAEAHIAGVFVPFHHGDFGDVRLRVMDELAGRAARRRSLYR